MAEGNFQQAESLTLRSEGGYSDDAHDPGGATQWGIIQREYDTYLQKHGLPETSVRNLTIAERDDIYRTNYWRPMQCDDLPSGLDYAAFDAAVNSGVSRARQWLKECGGSIDALCDKRLSFLKGLSNWRYFGKGWGARVEFVRRNAKAMTSGSPIHDDEWVNTSLAKLGYTGVSAIKKFQADHSLVVDGCAGHLTCAAIEAALNQILSPDIAKTAALLCTAIYEYAGYPKEPFDHIITCEKGLYAGIKRINGIDYVIIRGTVSLMDWVRNIEAWVVNVKSMGPVHAGFHADIPEAWSKIKPLLGEKFVIAGHSRGAAEAKILAAYAIRDNKVPSALVCFGAPRAGYQELADCLKAISCKSYRNTAGVTDPVTKVPFTLDWVEPFVDEIVFTDISVAPTPDDTFPDAPEDFRPHYMPLYAKALNAFPLAQAA